MFSLLWSNHKIAYDWLKWLLKTIRSLEHRQNFAKIYCSWLRNKSLDDNPCDASIQGNRVLEMNFTTSRSNNFPLCAYERWDGIFDAASGTYLLFGKSFSQRDRVRLLYAEVYQTAKQLTTIVFCAPWSGRSCTDCSYICGDKARLAVAQCLNAQPCLFTLPSITLKNDHSYLSCLVPPKETKDLARIVECKTFLAASAGGRVEMPIFNKCVFTRFEARFENFNQLSCKRVWGMILSIIIVTESSYLDELLGLCSDVVSSKKISAIEICLVMDLV